MPAYIEVTQSETPTCKQGDDCEINDNVTHHVSVKIGPAILGPLFTLILALEESHGAEIQHYIAGPKRCKYCAAISRGKKLYKAIDGRPL